MPTRYSDPHFRLVFVTAVALTALCGALVGVAAFSWADPLTSAQDAALTAATSLFTAGVGVVLGLLGGRQVGKLT